ncbi:MAG: [NiFe]-hydrogenase assembly chaperone HybE, partial [Plesiomonas shigelloides]
SSLFSDMRLFESHMAARATGEEVIRQLFPVSEEGMDLQRRRLFLLGSAN